MGDYPARPKGYALFVERSEESALSRSSQLCCSGPNNRVSDGSVNMKGPLGFTRMGFYSSFVKPIGNLLFEDSLFESGINPPLVWPWPGWRR